MKRFIVFFLLGLSLTVLLAGCGDTTINNTPTGPSATNVNPNAAKTQIEFRVTGNATQVRIRYGNPIDGIAQTITGLPFSVVFETDRTVLFITLDVTPIAFAVATPFPFLSAQIYVNGTLFREATSFDFASSISASGNWRK